MRVEILNRISPNIVEFKSKIGNGAAIVVGDFSTMSFYDVEFNIKEEIHFESEIVGTNSPESYLRYDSGFNYITGLVEDIDADGEVCFRLDSSCILLFYFRGLMPAVGDFITIVVDCRNFEMFIVGT